MREVGEVVDWGEGFEGEAVVEGELGGGDYAEAFGEVEVVWGVVSGCKLVSWFLYISLEGISFWKIERNIGTDMNAQSCCTEERNLQHLKSLKGLDIDRCW